MGRHERQTEIEQGEVRHVLVSAARTEMAAIFAANSTTRAFHEGRWTEEAYYKAYLIELVHRTQLNNQADAAALALMGPELLPLARDFAAGLADEYNHLDYALDDLGTFGVTVSAAWRAGPGPATKALVGYLRTANETDGVLANIVWNWFQQWHSDSYEARFLQRAAVAFGTGSVTGGWRHLRGHVAAIEAVAGRDRYDDTLFSGVHTLIGDTETLERGLFHLRQMVRRFGTYFTALEHHMEVTR